MTETDFEFEVYCHTCGEGLCYETEVVKTYKRGQDSIRVNCCPECKKKLEEEIESLKKQVEELTEELRQSKEN